MKTSVTYGTVRQTYFFGNRTRTVYGIAALSEDGEVLCESLGISEDEKCITALARLCESLELSPMHLCDVAEDFIFEQKNKLCHF